nr:hypothetical protein [Myxococcota bacterium]
MRARAWIATVAWIALAHPASGAVDLLSWSHEVVELPHDGSPFSILTDLNDANIGAGNLTGPFGTAATLWTPRPCPPDCVPLVFDRHPLPEMAGTNDFVTGISNLGPGGTVAVSAARLDDATGASMPVVFTFLAATPSTVSAVPLPLPDGFAQGSAQDVNARGDVVGWVDTAAADSQQAVVWDFNGSTYTPVLLPATDAFAISDDGPVGATAGSEVRLFPDPTLDPMDFAPLDGGSPFVQLFDL